jgi:hypothetical protein
MEGQDLRQKGGEYISGPRDWAKNEIRIKNLPADIEEHETDRRADFLQCLTRGIESQVGAISGIISSKFWFEDSKGYGPSLTAQLETDSVFETKFTRRIEQGQRIARENSVRVDFEGKTHRVHTRPTIRSIARVEEGASSQQ